jgi:hypothetical protein
VGASAEVRSGGLQALTLAPGEGPFVPVVTGFLGKGVSTGAICTLGRGGSDLSATVIGAALDLEEVRATAAVVAAVSASSANMQLTALHQLLLCIQRGVYRSAAQPYAGESPSAACEVAPLTSSHPTRRCKCGKTWTVCCPRIRGGWPAPLRCRF